MADKLIISNEGIKIESFTQEEVEQRELEQAKREEEEILNSLLPSQDEIENAEFDLNVITLLSTLEVI